MMSPSRFDSLSTSTRNPIAPDSWIRHMALTSWTNSPSGGLPRPPPRPFESPFTLWTATGNSGHGVMHSPAEGELLTELILDGKFSTLDASILRPTRFAEGAAIQGPLLL